MLVPSGTGVAEGWIRGVDVALLLTAMLYGLGSICGVGLAGNK
jgi:hypothetical protein